MRSGARALESSCAFEESDGTEALAPADRAAVAAVTLLTAAACLGVRARVCVGGGQSRGWTVPADAGMRMGQGTSAESLHLYAITARMRVKRTCSPPSPQAHAR